MNSKSFFGRILNRIKGGKGSPGPIIQPKQATHAAEESKPAKQKPARGNYWTSFKTEGSNRHVSPQVRRRKAKAARVARRVQRRKAAA